jgi:hypothetical protein
MPTTAQYRAGVVGRLPYQVIDNHYRRSDDAMVAQLWLAK